MPTLDGAFAFSEMYVIAVLVREYLYFDMARQNDRLFDIDGVIAKTRESFSL